MKKVSSFPERLKEIIDKKELSYVDIENGTGISNATISRYVNEKREATAKNIEILADFLNVHVAYLMGYEEDFSRYGLTPVTTHKVPLLGSVACGKPVFADQDIESYVDAGSIGADFALHCKGDSMTGAGIYDGDIAYIRRQSDLRSGEIGIVLIGDEATLKRFYRYPTQIELHAENPAYPALVFKEREAEEVVILGKLVGFYHEIK